MSKPSDLVSRIERLRQLKMAQEQKSAEYLIKANETDERITLLEIKLEKMMMGGR